MMLPAEPLASRGSSRVPWRKGPTMKRLALIAALVVAAVAAIAVRARIVQVQSTSGQWGLTVTEAAPNRIEVQGRDYTRGHVAPLRKLPSGFVKSGATEGGGTLLLPDGWGKTVPVVIFVRDNQVRIWPYGLVGGP
jgi:hypothetical protein